MKKLLTEIKNCTICPPHLPHGCRPVVTAHPKSKILIKESVIPIIQKQTKLHL